MPALGVIGTVYAIDVERVWPHVRAVAVPDLVGISWQADPRDLARAAGVIQAEFHPRRMGGEQREVYPAAVPGGAQRHGFTGDNAQARGGDPVHGRRSRITVASGGKVSESEYECPWLPWCSACRPPLLP